MAVFQDRLSIREIKSREVNLGEKSVLLCELRLSSLELETHALFMNFPTEAICYFF